MTRAPHRILHGSLTGHSARLADAIAHAPGAEAEAVSCPAYRGVLAKPRMALDFATPRVPAPAPPAPGLGAAASVTLCGPVWAGRPAPALRALLRLHGLPGAVGLALTCEGRAKSGGAADHAEAILGRPPGAAILH